jgi:hypothetical protein
MGQGASASVDELCVYRTDVVCCDCTEQSLSRACVVRRLLFVAETWGVFFCLVVVHACMRQSAFKLKQYLKKCFPLRKSCIEAIPAAGARGVVCFRT